MAMVHKRQSAREASHISVSVPKWRAIMLKRDNISKPEGMCSPHRCNKASFDGQQLQKRKTINPGLLSVHDDDDEDC